MLVNDSRHLGAHKPEDGDLGVWRAADVEVGKGYMRRDTQTC